MNQDSDKFQLIFRVFTMVSLLVIMGQLAYLMTGKSQPKQRAQAAPERPSLEQNADMSALKSGTHIRGDKNAAVSLVLFNSFTCGFCKRFKESIDYVLKNNQGKVNLVYRPFNRSKADIQYSMAVECAGEQNKFWEMYDAIFSGQFSDSDQAAKSIGLNTSSFRTCINSGKYESKSQQDTKTGVELGISGTPGYVINGETKIGYKPGPALDEEIKAAMQ